MAAGFELMPLDKLSSNVAGRSIWAELMLGSLSTGVKLQLNRIQLKTVSSIGQVLLDAARSPELIPESR
jgi:hypothetical protein